MNDLTISLLITAGVFATGTGLLALFSREARIAEQRRFEEWQRDQQRISYDEWYERFGIETKETRHETSRHHREGA